ncbi:hypothetical protein JCM8547_000576 [Rhodosporidiobolus lusitaniae]
MATTDVDECWVCGKKTEKWCSSCSAHGFHIYFCSIDHQKLSWKHHKRLAPSILRGTAQPPKPFAKDFFTAGRGLLCLVLLNQQTLAHVHDQRFAHLNPFFHIGALVTPLSHLTPHPLKGRPQYRLPTSAAHRALVLFDLVQRSRSASPPSSFDKAFVEYALMRFVEEHTKGKPFASGQQAAFFCFVLDTTLSKVDYRLKRFAYIHQTNQLDYTGLSA